MPQRGPVITHILRSPTVKINLSSDPTQPHPLASLRAAPVLADAAGRRTASRGEEGRSAVLHHQTGLLQQNNTLQEKRKERKKKKKRCFLEGQAKRGGNNAVFHYTDHKARWRRTHSKEQPLSRCRGLGRGDKRQGEASPRPLVTFAERLLSTFTSYLYTCASAFSKKAVFRNHWQTEQKTKRRVRSAWNPQALTKTRLFSASSRLQLMPINH